MLERFESSCDERQKIIVSRDTGSKCMHRANNIKRCLVRQYQIDGYVITDPNEKKCDYLILNDDKKDAYLIELKGTELLHALEQIEQTEKILGRDLSLYEKYYRIVYRANTHDIHSLKFTKFVKTKGGRVKAATNLIEENI